MMMNIINPYYTLETTPSDTLFFNNKAESHTPPGIFPQPLGHLPFLVGPCIHSFQNQLQFAPFKIYHRFNLYS